jgi:hypothetical protein
VPRLIDLSFYTQILCSFLVFRFSWFFFAIRFPVHLGAM